MPWPAAVAAEERVPIAAFSAASPGESLPTGWLPYRIGNNLEETRYRLASIEGRTVLEARSDASASALAHALRADPKRTPWLSFSWRIESLIERADIRTKGGDDYPVRVYVIFDYDASRLRFADRMKLRMARAIWGEQVPAAALCYVWEPRQPVGYSQWSAYTDRLRMVVAESGSVHVGQWVHIERNVADDYRSAFGEEPPAITAIVVATDTDNTASSVRAWFGDIGLSDRRNDAGQR